MARQALVARGTRHYQEPKQGPVAPRLAACAGWVKPKPALAPTRSVGGAGTATQGAGSHSPRLGGEGAIIPHVPSLPISRICLRKAPSGASEWGKTQHFIKDLLPSPLRLSPPQLLNRHLPSQDRDCCSALENCKVLHFSSKSPPRGWGRFPGLLFYPSAGTMLKKGKKEGVKQRARLVHASLQLFTLITPLSSQASACQTLCTASQAVLWRAARKAKPREPELPRPRCPAARPGSCSQNLGLKVS